MIQNNKSLKFSMFFFVCFFYHSFNYAFAQKINQFTNSISIQIGANGTTKSGNFGLQFIPPDISYSREIFDNDFLNISTATFYDNIGVKINNSNFSYRLGQRIDFGIEIHRFTPYLTIGIAAIKNVHHFHSSAVYGSEILYRVSKRIILVNELNFQNVHFQSQRNKIVNLSTGLVFAF